MNCVGFYYAGSVHSGKRNVTVWCPSVCPSAYSPGAACDAADVHFGPTITRTGIVLKYELVMVIVIRKKINLLTYSARPAADIC